MCEEFRAFPRAPETGAGTFQLFLFSPIGELRHLQRKLARSPLAPIVELAKSFGADVFERGTFVKRSFSASSSEAAVDIPTSHPRVLSHEPLLQMAGRCGCIARWCGRRGFLFDAPACLRRPCAA